MGKNTIIYPQRRIQEYPDDGFIIGADDQLHCGLCNKDIDAKKASKVAAHVETKKHQSHRSAVKSKPSIAVALRPKDTWRDLVDVFLDAGVPLKIFRNDKFRQWTHANVKDGKTLPCETSIRKLVNLSAKEDEEATKSILQDKDIIVIADESTDLKNRKVLNILLGSAEPNSKFRLVATKFLDEVNAVVVSSAIIDAIRNMGISYDHVVCICSDNAPYMIAAGRTLSGIFSRLFHTTCWSHILHLIGEEIRTKLKIADEYIAAIKAAVIKAPARRDELMTCFESHGLPRRIPPVPVLTRWCTWLEAGAFHFNSFEAEVDWIQTTSDDSAAVNKLKRLVEETVLLEQLKQVADICPTISSAIKTLESNNRPACGVWFELRTVAGAYFEVFGEESPKLTLYMSSKHPALDYWKDVQFFDPRKSKAISPELNALPASLKRFQTMEIPSTEFVKLREILASYSPTQFCPFKFCSAYEREMPVLSSAALRALSIPSSSAEVERSFSALRRLLTPQRSNFTEENLCSHLKLAFNKLPDVEELSNGSEMNSSSEEED